MKEPDYDNVVARIKETYSSCSKAEQDMLQQILTELASTGYSYTYEQIYLSDFKEVPVSIDQFLNDPAYMGNATNRGQSIYPFWRSMMTELFSHGNKYNEIVLSGSTRIGKTHSMIFIMSYMLYRLMIYRDPRAYFKKSPTTRFYIAFANLTQELAHGVAYRTYNDTLRESDWFQNHGKFSRSDRKFYYIPEGDKIDIIAGSDSAHMLGLALFAVGMDECNFAKAGVKDITLAKQHMKNLYDTVNARISGSFRIGGEVYGKMITASSKNTDSDFLSSHIEKQLNAGNTHLYLVDEPQWKVLPKEMFSNEVFHFTVGDRYKRGFVIPEADDDEAHRTEYERQGYRVIEAPAELRKNFLADYDISLRDIAGISVAGSMGFVNQADITPCVSQERQNPFFENVIEVGVEDSKEIFDFFHDEVVPNELKVQEMHIHIDLAETHNHTGIVGCCVTGNKVIEQENGKKVALPFIKEIFSVEIKAPRGQRQSFQKVINFLVYLRQHHYNVGTISTDQYQSSFLRETLNQQGFRTNKFAVDMDQFIGLRNLLLDQRIELNRNDTQETELTSVQRINNKIFIPEDEDGGHGDTAVALAGSTYSLILEQITARPPAKSIAAIAAAVNSGRGRSNPMSSANTVKSLGAKPTNNIPVRFPKLR